MVQLEFDVTTLSTWYAYYRWESGATGTDQDMIGAQGRVYDDRARTHS